MRVWPGSPTRSAPRGTGEGVNFALFSEHARTVELCLFDAPGDATERQRIALPERTDYIWHAYLPEAAAGPALRLPRARPVRPGAGPSLQPRTSC